MTFSIIPILMNVFLSFTSYNVIQRPQLVWFGNYLRMFKDPYISASFKNTVLFTLIIVPCQTVISLLLAAIIAANFKKTFGNFVRSALFIPVIASSVLVGTLWSLLLSSYGPINELLKILGLPTVNWFGGKISSIIGVSAATVWKHIGYFLVIFYAGILDIPASLYEAAKVDGANPIQTFFNITLPGLSKITYLIITLGTIWSFQIFDMVYTMTGGGPGLSTVTLVLTIYNTAFKEYNMGYASAIALLMFILVVIIQAVQKKLLAGGKDE
ncbi:MAG: carbohydrate ABC transporter permease [Treponema sp.]|uniref:carbohydrate ABC transporter permease n=1 Tax=Treponema sp. TaxID=166 RepID=UPI003FA29D73